MLDILVPVLHRPWRAEAFMFSLLAVTPLADVRVTVIAGPDDLRTADAWAKTGAHVVVCPAEPGSFPQRINYGYRRTYHEWMFLTGDDVAFHPLWLDKAYAVAQNTGAHVVGTQDLGNGAVLAGIHATHMLVRRQYVDEVGASWDGPGVVCHEGYRHCYVDNEIVEAAKQRGCWAMAMDSVVEHLHPAWGKSEIDDTYAIGIETMGADRMTFNARYAEHR